MKNKKISYINAIIVIIIVLSFGFIMNVFFKHYALNDFAIKEESKFFIFGDSHAATNFFQSDNGIQNFGYGSEPPNLTLLKLKYLFTEERYEKLKAVIVISPHNISKCHEMRFFNNDSTAAILSKHWVIIDNQYVFDHYNNLPIKTKAVIHLKKFFGAPSMENSFLIKTAFKGGFKYLEGNSELNDKALIEANNRHFGNANFNYKNNVSYRLKEYYYNIFNFLKIKNIETIVVSTPLHDTYWNLLTNEQILNYQTFINEIETDYSEIKVLNYSRKKMSDKYFFNGDHLNKEGAIIFTDLFIKDIKI